jgi:FkbM family methyltransferase
MGLSDRLRQSGRNIARAARNRDGYRKVAGRDYAFRALRRFTPYAGVESDGISYLVSTGDYSIGRETYMYKGYDADVMERLIDLASREVGRRPFLENKTFIDIGANIGTTSIPAQIRFGAASGFAFEPAPDTFKLLKCNLVLNGLEERVRAVPVALSDKAGSATLELSNLNWGDSRVRSRSGSDEPSNEEAEDLLGEGGWATVEVETARFDDLVEGLGIDLDTIGLVWVDTQGHEANVLAGASTVLDRRLPLVTEYWPYALRRAGGLERLHDLLGAYPRFIDARAAEPRALPTSALSDLARAYPGVDDYTDLLLVQ